MTPPTARKFSGIFISYRRDDSAGHAGRLYDRLFAHFGPTQVFMDIDQIEPGEDFVQVIEMAVGSCDVVLAVIGRRWLTAGDGTTRRLDNPKDFVRLEIATALKRNVRVIPVLVADATMPGEQDLPAELSKLSRRNAVELSDVRWNRDVQQLIQVLDKLLANAEAERRAAREAEESRRVADDEARRRQQDEARRQQEENQRRREQARAAQAAGEERRRRDAEAHRRREAEAQRVQAEEAARRRDEAERQRARGPATAAGQVTPVPDGWASEWRPPAEGPKRAPRAVIIGATVLGLLIFVVLALTPKYELGPSENVAPGANRVRTDTGASLDANSLATAREMITTTNVNLRSGPNSAFKTIGVVEKGARVRVLQTAGGWAEIEIVQRGETRRVDGGETRGWMVESFLR